MNVSVVFNADTGQYEAKLTVLDTRTARTAQAVADAKNKILAYHQEQIASAAKLGKSAEDLERIQTKTLNAMANVTEANAGKMIASIDRIRDRNRRMQEEMKRLPPLPEVPSERGHGFTDRMATSAVVRTLDGNPGIRAEENFLSQFPAFTKAAQGLAVAIGAAGIAGALIEMGVKGAEAFEKVQHAAENLRESFEEQHDHNQVLIDDKEIENQKIQDQIDKLSGHPNNGLATALLEAKKMADQLVVSLQEDRKQLEALFKENDLGTFGKALSAIGFGPSGTGEQQDELLKDQKDLLKKVRDARHDMSVEMAKAPDDAGRDAARKRFNDRAIAAAKEQQDSYNREIARLQKAEADSRAGANLPSAVAMGGYGGMGNGATPHVDNSLKIENLRGRSDELQDFIDTRSVESSLYSGEKKLGKLKQEKGSGGGVNKAAEEQMKALELADAQLKAKFAADHNQMLAAEAGFWEAMAASPKILPQNQARILNEATSSQQAYERALDEQIRKDAAARAKQQQEQKESWDKDYEGWIESGHRSAQAIADYWSIRALEADLGSANELEAEKKANDALKQVLREREQIDQARKRMALEMAQADASAAQTRLEINEHSGRISPGDAAREQQRIHQQEAAARLAALQDDYDRSAAKDAQTGKDSGDPNYQSAETLNALTALNRAKAEQLDQQMQDSAKIAATTWQGALTNAFDEWYQHAKDTAAQVAQLFNQAITSTNENLVNMMSGDYKRGDFKKEGHELFKNIAGSTLQHGEASLLGGLGLGPTAKADGSKANPFFVKFADSLKDDLGGGSGGGFFGHLFGGKPADDSNGDSGGGISGFLGHLFGGKQGDNSNSDSSGGISGFFSHLFGGGGDSGASSGDGGGGDGGIFSFLGGFALGGDVPDPGGFADVGEMGRERVFLPGGSKVVPHHALNSGDTHIHVDARGAHDPAQVEAAVHRAMSKHGPALVQASVAAMKDRQMRRPHNS